MKRNVKGPIERVDRALTEFRAGKMIILVDDEERENEGDLCMAAEAVTPAAINFMAREGRGLICLALSEERIRRLHLPLMVVENESPYRTAFTVSIEAARGVTTGISAKDRAHTILTAVAPAARAEDLVRPGHIFPLRAKPGGVLARVGQTEGSVDLARLAGMEPAAVICEIMNDDGTMSRMPDLEKFGVRHGLHIVSIADLVKYRLERERLVRRVAESVLPLGAHGDFTAIAYQIPGEEERTHLALVKGDVRGLEPVVVRMHAQCTVGDLFGSTACTCGEQLHRALAAIAREGRGALVYLQPPGRGGASILQCARMAPEEREGASTGSFRDYGVGAQILSDLGIRKLRLLSNSEKKLVGLQGYGLEVVERLPIPLGPERPKLAAARRPRRAKGKR